MIFAKAYFCEECACLQAITELIQKDPDFQNVISNIQKQMKDQLVAGLHGSSKPVFLASVQQHVDRPLFIVTHNLFAAQKIAEDLADCLSADEVLLFPAQETLSTEVAISSPEMTSQRVEVLTKLSTGYHGIVVAPYAAVRRILPALQSFQHLHVTIKVGDTLDLKSFLERFVELGYERVERVESKGEWSVRGGIIDFFPLSMTQAVRVELFDVTIDSIRLFDPVDQRSTTHVHEFTIQPSREIPIDPSLMRAAANHATELLDMQLEKMTDRQAKNKLQDGMGYEIECLRQGQYFPGLFKYISLLYPERHTLIDYMPVDTVMILDEPTRLVEVAKQMENDDANWALHALQDGKSLPSLVFSKNTDHLFHRRTFPTLHVSLFLRQIPTIQPQHIVNFVSRAMQSFHGQLHLLKSEVERWHKNGFQIIVLANGDERKQHVMRVLADYQMEKAQVHIGNLQSGFELPSVKCVVITEGEIFSQKQRKVRKVEKKIDNAERIKSYQELKVGDYVVHAHHGIGKYVGIGTLEIAGIHKDYLHIIYAGADKLSVPIEQIHLIQKYVGAEDKEPKLYKLGGSEWARVKSKVRSSVKDIADELVKLYAARQAVVGHAFSKDNSYQQEFEAMFPYEETPDQERAIAEIKADMELARPMDRLLCGDVGYGKTEVAIRAAFKSALDGKQVAILVPTTILAQQHYETFRERFNGYPFNIQVLSRFRSKKEQTEIIKSIKSGAVDIVIGTHRILSDDIQFKNIGLLVVDEEQRFGVTHKEKLKRIKTNVDVLTLTATPIPRTLQMSMLGVRDLSVIETPPENRFPVQTYVIEHNISLVKDAIERELSREGQIYYLYNRVQGITQIADQISQLVPDARVAVAHGQMGEQELERTILDFLDGEFDVLVSTSIIETGVDIPNVNTLIVHDADKMGLSQLYQIRGRVGRSNRVAYAYFTYQRDKVLTEIAEKRLQAIKEFTELGSGFKIAMRDLTIRGAGNLLGAEQHGFIASVGFDMYSQMLTEEIEKRKQGDEAVEHKEVEWNTHIDMQINAYIPSEYIYNSIQKIEIYKKVADIRTFEEADELFEEMKDRFGQPPQAVLNLLCVSRIKIYGAMYHIESIQLTSAGFQIKIHSDQNTMLDGQKLITLSSKFEGRVRLMAATQIQLHIKCNGLNQQQSIDVLEAFLKEYHFALKSKGENHVISKPFISTH